MRPAGLGAGILLAAVVTLAAPPAARAQTTGSVAGQVTDAVARAGLAGVSVLLDGTRLGAVTGPDGRYRIAAVPPGSYTVVVDLSFPKKIPALKTVMLKGMDEIEDQIETTRRALPSCSLMTAS